MTDKFFYDWLVKPLTLILLVLGIFITHLLWWAGVGVFKAVAYRVRPGLRQRDLERRIKRAIKPH